MDTTAEGTRRQMVDWLLGREARLAARAELRRYGLDAYDPDDLVNDVVVRLLQAELDGGVDHPVAYARRALTNRARDLLGADRVRRRRADAPPTRDDGDDAAAVVDVEDPAALDPGLVASARAVETDLRRRLQLALVRTRTWVVAAALSTLTLRLHDDVAVPEGVPAPEVGSRDKADRWAALWLAGERSAFAGSGAVETMAIRKARSRKLKDVDALLREVAERGGRDG
jgi:DNA-directed RNA polymerase specialized sigma24 family protein